MIVRINSTLHENCKAVKREKIMGSNLYIWRILKHSRYCSASDLSVCIYGMSNVDVDNLGKLLYL